MSQIQPRTNMSNVPNTVDNTSVLNKLSGKELSNYDMMEIRKKYGSEGNEAISKILEEHKERREKINNIAHLFVDKFIKKFGISMPLHSILVKANKYKKKYNLSDDEFAQVQKVFEERLFNSMGPDNKVTTYNNTNLSRALGNAFIETFDGIVVNNTEDYQYVQEIIKLYALHKQNYQYIILQTSTYTDLDNTILTTAKFENRYNKMVHINPVLVALFMPKIKELEERMLYANLAGIIHARYNKTNILTKPDSDLLYSLVNDPNDIVCSNATPIIDLFNRCLVQVNLWKAVFEMRNNKFYTSAASDFLGAIDNCKINNNDNPELVILSDEGIILRRLFASFSFRPIHVITVPLTNNIIQNPYGYVNDTKVINSLPYLTYRLPLIKQDNETYSLAKANEQSNFYLDNNLGRFIAKKTQLFQVNGPLVYYVPRKSMDMPIIHNLSPNNLPIVTNTRINNNAIPLDIEYDINPLNEDNSKSKYLLRSCVTLKFKDVNLGGNLSQNNRMITGNTTMLFKYLGDNDINLYKMPKNSPEIIYMYEPVDVDVGPNPLVFKSINNATYSGSDHELLVKESGCIYIYTKVTF